MVVQDSGWPLVYWVADLHTGELVRTMRCIFMAKGVAEDVTSDGALVFRGHEFQKFCATLGIRHR